MHFRKANVELINGQIYNMVSPNYIHQHLVMELSGTIHEYILKQS